MAGRARTPRLAACGIAVGPRTRACRATLREKTTERNRYCSSPLCRKRARAHPEHPFVYANVINNMVSTHLHQALADPLYANLSAVKLDLT